MNRHLIIACAVLATALFSLNVCAAPKTAKPVTGAAPSFAPVAEPAALDPRLVRYSFDANYTFPIVTSAGKLTHVQFAPDEKILGVYLVDSASAWRMIVSSETHRDIFFNPARNGLEQTGTIITNKRSYEISLVSRDSEGYFQRVSWDYAPGNAVGVTDYGYEAGAGANVGGSGTERADASRASTVAEREDARVGHIDVDLANANFGYTVKGDASFKPSMVFDDGKFTFVRFPDNIQSLPAAFLLKKNGHIETLQYVPQEGGYYRIPRLVEYGLLLRLGKEEVKVFNNRGGGCGFFGCHGSAPVNMSAN
ncbi:TrbG/VirB9 family P-type conjugative transfer protein [Robbsia andropogonis]|uniref:TrbG/VirB9 family P-type conjugative transfer protein n=1 Tax=Robbsia andropogonis TaxID=28092 RepID=UPI000696AD2E|nr:TrbG/VirB9 family P-type conjugative transfer protein [Robbsia andropogonis]